MEDSPVKFPPGTRVKVKPHNPDLCPEGTLGEVKAVRGKSRLVEFEGGRLLHFSADEELEASE